MDNPERNFIIFIVPGNGGSGIRKRKMPINYEGKIIGYFPGTDPGEAKAKIQEHLKKEEK